jgi:hypothetical protein
MHAPRHIQLLSSAAPRPAAAVHAGMMTLGGTGASPAAPRLPPGGSPAVLEPKAEPMVACVRGLKRSYRKRSTSAVLPTPAQPNVTTFNSRTWVSSSSSDHHHGQSRASTAAPQCADNNHNPWIASLHSEKNRGCQGRERGRTTHPAHVYMWFQLKRESVHPLLPDFRHRAEASLQPTLRSVLASALQANAG